MSNRALCASSAGGVSQSPRNAANRGSTSANGGASRTSASVMPWTRITFAGIGRPGFTNSLNVPRSRPARSNRAAPISTVRSTPALHPVVSRSKATKVRPASAASEGIVRDMGSS